AEKDAENLYYGIPAVTRVDGSVVKPAVQALTYQDAIRRLVARYPKLGASGVIRIVDTLYQPGEGGRPDKPIRWGPIITSGGPLGVQAQVPLAGKGSVAAGADRPGVSISPSVVSFVDRISGIAGVPLTITTGTNHNQFVVNTNRQSDHWTGHAADIAYGHGSPGRPDPALTRLGQKALIAAGADPAWARRQTGGVFNLQTSYGRVQILFNTLTGGNHYNHL